MGGRELQCLAIDTPTVVSVKHAFGERYTEKWIATHIIELNEYCGVKDKMTINQIDQLSRVLVSQYGWLKPQEFLLFFLKLKAGEYGHPYGVIDPMFIGECFNKFLTWRRGMLDKVEAERLRREREEQDKITTSVMRGDDLAKLIEQFKKEK